jgi:hypothetical protein
VLAREVHLRMHDTHVSRQSIVARECLLFDAKRATDFLLASVVDGVLVTGEIIRTREDRIARLAGCGVDALTLVRPRLGVAI